MCSHNVLQHKIDGKRAFWASIGVTVRARYARRGQKNPARYAPKNFQETPHLPWLALTVPGALMRAVLNGFW